MIRTIYRNGILVIVALLLCALAIWPPEKSLRKGRDLAGGVSMIYSVQIGPNEDRKEILNKTIEVVKKRVDPQGLLEISIVPQGEDRIEITMPLPGDDVKKLKAAYEERLVELGRTALNEARLDRVLAMAPAERSAEFKSLSRTEPAREELLVKAAAAHDAAKAARAEYDALTDAAAKDAKAADVARAELALAAAQRDVLRTVLPVAEVRRALLLPDVGRSLEDPETQTFVKIPSPRQQTLERIKSEFPGAAGQVDEVVSLFNTYSAQRTTLDDPNDLVRLLRGAGVLTFRIAAAPGEHPEEARLRSEFQERGPANVRSSDSRWYKINKIESWYKDTRSAKLLNDNPSGFFGQMGYVVEGRSGEFYMLCWDTRGKRLTPAEGDWSVASARQSTDTYGKPAISFNMDPRGAKLLGELTRDNVNKKMAVLLDDQVYTAPNLISAISASGQIVGDFSGDDISYVVQVLAAGSLQAKLSPEPLSTDVIGPELGADNLRQGLIAGVYAIVFCSGFIVVYYFGAGLVAVIALLVNSILILGAMAAQHAAFTMPGIAGMILSFGMAVDSNVLIYERMREEMARGADLKTAVRLGFSKAFSSIVDGNVTNLIVCIVLASPRVSTQEITGFGITMAIGVLATLFCALILSRLMFDLLVGVFGVRKMPMLPTVWPGLQRLLTPNINWMRLRYVFFTISIIYVSLGIIMAISRGQDMLDTQFRGGTSLTFSLKPDGSGTLKSNGTPNRLTMTRSDLEDMIHAIGESAEANSALAALRTASITPLNPGPDGVSSDSFRITTTSTAKDTIASAVFSALQDKIESQPRLSFRGAGETFSGSQLVYVIDKKGPIGPTILRPGVSVSGDAFVGGVAIVLDDLRPAPSLADLAARLDKARNSSKYSDTLGRRREVVTIAGDDNAVRSAVVLVQDDSISPFDNTERFAVEMKDREWTLANDALTAEGIVGSVQSIGSTVAATFKARAIAATLISFVLIAIYIWVRFKSSRYALAAIVAVLHDVLSVIALVSMARWLFDNESTRGFAQQLMILPFKIDLTLVAAILTVAGYSLNDTIVVMDRVRELRGKLPHASATMINEAINSTISRTLITGGTTLASSIILYIVGGEGVRAFSFALIIGIVFGTYSSIAVACPLVWSRKADKQPSELPDSIRPEAA